MDQRTQSRPLDLVDRMILRELQANARLSNVELSRRVNLSPTPCLERVRRLEREGYISDYVALLEPSKLGSALLIFVEVTLDQTTEKAFGHFKESVLGLPEVLECHMVAGGFDYLVKVRVSDMEEYRQFLGEKLAELPGVRQTHTYVVMEEVKSTTFIRVPDTVS